MIRDRPVPLADDSPGCSLEERRRSIQNGTDVYWVSLNRDWLRQLGLGSQGELTVHSLATRPVEIHHPAIVIQPAEVIER